MKICVYGLWHLGCVTAACLAEAGFSVVGLDLDQATISHLNAGRALLFEPGLDGLIARNISQGRLTFSTDIAMVEEADVVWVCFDTPVDENDIADVAWVVTRIQKLFSLLPDGSLVLVSSQVPVGTIRDLEAAYAASGAGRRVRFACSPENLRLGQALKNFAAPDRIVVGVRDDESKALLEKLLGTFSRNLIWVGVESAEMIKHAINSYLSVSITFTNELARLCETTGADAFEVERGMRSEPRIGTQAYVHPGGAIAGGTLTRDIRYLMQLARDHELDVPLLDAIPRSNENHRGWPLERVKEMLPQQREKVAVLGLSYKPGTDSTRRSLALYICRELLATGYTVSAFDPVVTALPPDLGAVMIEGTMATALEKASAAIIATEWPQFRETITAELLCRTMLQPTIIDQSGLLGDRLGRADGVRYVSLGRRS